MTPHNTPEVDEAIREIYAALYRIQKSIVRLMEQIDDLYLEDIPPF